jgi:branched-chain amino acid transport system substrate-binding protein
VTDGEVLFGMHLPQSGPVGFLAGKAWHGADAYFRSVNAAGGVHGRRIRIVVADDGYSAQKAAGAIRDLVDNKKVFTASCLAGVDQCVVGLEYANARGVPYLHGGMSEGAVANKAWAYPVTASYPYGAVRLADYLFTRRGYTPARKIGAIHVNSPYYLEMADALDARLRHHGSRFAVRQVAEKDQSDFSAAIIKMQNAGVDTVWFFIDPTLMAKFTAQAKALRFSPQYVFSPPVGGDLFAAGTGGNLDGAFGLATFAAPQWPGAARFRATFAAAYPDESPSEFDILSYTVAQAFVEGVRRAGPDLGRDAFARAMDTIDSFDTGVSSPLSYTRRHRLAAANSTLAVWQIKGTKTEQLTGFDF